VGQNGNGTSSRQKLEKVVIRFAGDSGDGMQLTGDRFTSEAALFGNDLATQPNYPAEIRAPQGTLPGVSSFQIQIADYDILTAGDRPDVLVAMNPAALKANVSDLPRGGLIIANSDEFTKRNLAKVGYELEPVDRAWRAFERVRRTYAGRLEGLAAYWATPAPSWSGQKVPHGSTVHEPAATTST